MDIARRVVDTSLDNRRESPEEACSNADRTASSSPESSFKRTVCEKHLE